MVIAKPLTRVDIQGDVGYDDFRVPINGAKKKNLAFTKPLVLMAGKAGPYSGVKSANAEDVTLRSIAVNNNTVRFTEFDVQIPRSGTLQADSLTGSTTMEVTTTVAEHLRPQDMLHFPAENLNFRVVSVTSPIDGTITVERAIGSQVTTPATVNPAGFTQASDNDVLSGAEFLIIGPAVVQNSRARPVRSYNAVTIREAATQIFRTDIVRSNTRKAQERSSKAIQEKFEERKQQELFYMMDEIESTMLFGDMLADAGGRVNATGSSISTTADAEGNKYTTSDGIFNVIRKYASSNIIAANSATLGGGTSAMSRTKLNLISQLLDAVGGGHILLTSKDLLFKINEELTDPTKTQLNLPYDAESKAAGNPVITYRGLFGELKFQHHPMFDRATKYKKTILAIKPENLGLIALDGRTLKWKPQSQENDRDGEAGYYLAELGLVMSYAEEAYIFNEWTI